MTPKAQAEYLTLVREGKISKLAALRQLQDEHDAIMLSLKRIYDIGRSVGEPRLVAGFKSTYGPALVLGRNLLGVIEKEERDDSIPLPKVRSSVS